MRSTETVDPDRPNEDSPLPHAPDQRMHVITLRSRTLSVDLAQSKRVADPCSCCEVFRSMYMSSYRWDPAVYAQIVCMGVGVIDIVTLAGGVTPQCH